LPKRQLYASN